MATKWSMQGTLLGACSWIGGAPAASTHGPRTVFAKADTCGTSRKEILARCRWPLELGPILNSVTHEPEEIYVDKPTGFTSKRLTMGATREMRLNSEVKYDHSGKYGEFSKFEYSGESPD